MHKLDLAMASVAAFAAAAPAAAAELERLSDDSGRSVWYLDARSTRRSGDVATAWLVVEQRRQGVVQRRDRHLVSINCRLGQYRPIETASYAPDGALLHRAAMTEAEFGFEYYQPGAPVASAARQMCGDRRSGRWDAIQPYSARPDAR